MADYVEEPTDAGLAAFQRRAMEAYRLREEAKPERIVKGLVPGGPLDLFNDGHREFITTAIEMTRVRGEPGGYLRVGPGVDALQGLSDGEGATFTFTKVRKEQLRQAFQDDIDAELSRAL